MRHTAARGLLPLLVIVLFALPFLAPTVTAASAPVLSYGPTKTEPGKEPRGRTCEQTGEAASPLRARDRHRSVDVAPATPRPPRATKDPAAAYEPDVPAEHHQRRARSLTAHTPAALQVFRC